jgi:hypothetical protein
MNLENNELYAPLIKTGLKMGITMLANADVTLDADMGPLLFMTPSAPRNLTLPPVTADMKGLVLFVVNAAAFTLTVKNAAAANVAVVPATVGATGMIVCLGLNADGSTVGTLGGWSGGL